MATTRTAGTQSKAGGGNAWHRDLAGWKAILSRLREQISQDHVGVVAAGIAFYTLLSIFPAIAAFISVAGLILDPAEVAGEVSDLVAVLPESAGAIIGDQVTKVAGGENTATGFVALAGFAIAVYGAMKSILTLIEGLNIAYGEQETRGIVRLYATAFALTLGLIVGMALAIGVVVLLPVLLALGDTQAAGSGLLWLRWPILAGIAVLGFALVYRIGPAKRSAGWRWISPGAVLGTALWIAGTVGFSLYARYFGSYTETYGALGGVVILLTWLWVSAYAMLMGAELNSEIERQDSGAAGGAHSSVFDQAAPASTPPKASAPMPAAPAPAQAAQPAAPGHGLVLVGALALLLVGRLRRPGPPERP